MTMYYSDPYKDNKFGKLKGDKSQSYFKVDFTEVKIYVYEQVKSYSSENAYIVAGQFNNYMGVQHSYTGANAIEPGLCEIPIYGSEYDYRQKKAGTGTKDLKAEYETIKIQPSISELLLHKHIENNPVAYLEDTSFKGSITFYPDDNYTGMAEVDRLDHVLRFINLEKIPSSGQYPDWTPPKAYYKSNGYGGNRGASLDEKLVFLKTQLAEGVKEYNIRTDKTLPIDAYIREILEENKDNERFLVAYFELIKALISSS